MYLRCTRSYFCRNYVSFHSRFVPACVIRRHRVGLYADIVNSQRTMIFRDICHVSHPYSSPHFPLIVTIASGDAFKNGPALSWIISASLGTSWRRRCGGFIHRSVYFRFVLPPFPLIFSIAPIFSSTRGPHLLLH